jgi:hypothetical protein
MQYFGVLVGEVSYFYYSSIQGGLFYLLCAGLVYLPMITPSSRQSILL